MAESAKTAYVAPPLGSLEVTVVRDANPRVLLTLDLGIPNFSVFSMTMPLAEDEPQAMSGLIAEAVHVLLDEAASFMLSTEYDESVIVLMYATVLAAFKGMSAEADPAAQQSAVGQDGVVKTFEGTFELPMDFVNETQRRVVTGALGDDRELDRARATSQKLLSNPILKDYHTADEAAWRKAYGRARALYGFVARLMEEENTLDFENYGRSGDETLWRRCQKTLGAIEEAEKSTKPGEDEWYFRVVLLTRLLGDLNWILNTAKTDRANKDTLARIRRAGTVRRAPAVRRIELTYSPLEKTKPSDTARVIRMYRNRSLKQQPKPLYVVVYDQLGRPTGTIPIGPGKNFKNELLRATRKRAAVEFTGPVSFPTEEALRAAPLPGIPKAISVGGETFEPEAFSGVDMALYRGPENWLVKFVDGRTQMFPGRPTFRKMRQLNFPVPPNRFRWTLLPKEEEEEPTPGKKAAVKTGGLFEVYHGTNGTFSEFDDAYRGSALGKAPTNMAGFSFTDSEEVARTFGKNVVKAMVRIDRPYVIDAKGGTYSELKHVINRDLEEAPKEHDGVIIKNYADAGLGGSDYVVSNHYIPFSASQIKIVPPKPPVVGSAEEPGGRKPSIVHPSPDMVQKVHPGAAGAVVWLKPAKTYDDLVPLDLLAKRLARDGLAGRPVLEGLMVIDRVGHHGTYEGKNALIVPQYYVRRRGVLKDDGSYAVYHLRSDGRAQRVGWHAITAEEFLDPRPADPAAEKKASIEKRADVRTYQWYSDGKPTYKMTIEPLTQEVFDRWLRGKTYDHPLDRHAQPNVTDVGHLHRKGFDEVAFIHQNIGGADKKFYYMMGRAGFVPRQDGLLSLKQIPNEEAEEGTKP